MRLTAAALALLFILPGPAALAIGEIESLITDHDRARLESHEAVRAEALQEAGKGGEPADVKTLESLLAKPDLSFEGFDMTGEWRCRTIKAGGPAPLVVYSWFRCRVSDDGSGWKLEKLSGSQRTTGRFFTESDTRLIYLGTLHIGNEPAPAYGAGPESDQVGYAVRTGPEEWRIEFPAPTYESKFDILEFHR